MRRELLIEHMEKLEALGLSCQGCQGNCCTFEANSMMITPLEAVELITYLRTNAQDSEDLKRKCHETVQKFRLDQVVSTGRGTVLRRTYTCPFFGHTELGCPLPRTVKPYGCLAFNSHHAEKKAGEHCFSEREILVKRESSYPEEKELNKHYILRFSLNWEKAPIPLALLELWEKDFS